MHNQIIHSSIFSRYSELIFGMSTRNGGISPPPLGMNLSFTVGDAEENVLKNRSLFFGSLGLTQDQVAFARQVHGENVTSVNIPGKYDSCDALLTNAQGTYLAISVADCLPVFMYDPVSRSIAAVHSGWRGSVARIAQKAIKQLVDQFQADPKNIVAWLGPSAGVCCYETGEEVAAEFDQKYVSRMEGRKPHLDLKSFNTDLLLQAGVREENIEVSPDCTIHLPELYHSFRREGKLSGRMMVVMGLK